MNSTEYRLLARRIFGKIGMHFKFPVFDYQWFDSTKIPSQLLSAPNRYGMPTIHSGHIHDLSISSKCEWIVMGSDSTEV